MKPYASVDDYELRYGDVDIDKKALLNQLLMDATSRIFAELEAAGINPAAKGEVYAARLSQVCCTMVHRCMDTHDSDYGSMPPGVTGFSQDIGDFSRSFTFANVYTEPKLTRDERRFLRIPAARIRFVMPGVHDEQS